MAGICPAETLLSLTAGLLQDLAAHVRTFNLHGQAPVTPVPDPPSDA